MPAALMDIGTEYTEVYLYTHDPKNSDWRQVRIAGKNAGYIRADDIHWSGGMPVFKQGKLKQEIDK